MKKTLQNVKKKGKYTTDESFSRIKIVTFEISTVFQIYLHMYE